MLKPALLLACLASPAFADDLLFFQSPSGNISCMIGSGDFAGARCDIRDYTQTITGFSGGCELDWGDSFSIAPGDSSGNLVCHGDTVADENAMVLDYGQEISLGGITCSSARTGMSCTNARGHGFSVSRADQSLF